MSKQIIRIPKIVLDWSDWVNWRELRKDARGNSCVRVPNRTPGVYEVKYANADRLLTVGKAADLRMRVKQGLVKGKVPHSAGEKIRVKENTLKIVVRWAVTDRPAAVEEELHRKYKAKFGKLPKYVDHT